MPVFVEWRWQERTKSFLVIFHFYDDFSKSNLRIKRYIRDEKAIVLLQPQKSKVIFTEEAWMTWAPSHTEMALLTELLTYANIINGLGESQKKELKNPLEGRSGHLSDILLEIGLDKKVFFYSEDSEKMYAGAEICQEYIDYLRKLLEPYIK